MKLVFAHDTWFLRGVDGQVWTDRGSFPWDRYLEFADSITVVSRMRDLAPGESTERMALVSRPEVSFAPLPNLATPLGRVVRRRAARRELRAVLEGADALIARLPSEIGALACHVADDLGVVWAVELVTCPWDAIWNYGNWKGRVFAPVAWRETRRLLRRAPFALYVTEQFLQRRYPARRVHVGVSDVEIDPPGPSVLEQRLARIERAETPLVVGTIAALIAFKGLDTAFAALRSTPDATLRILGAGDVDRYRAMAADAGVADRVRFDGTLPSGEPVRRWLDDLDVYIQPSRQEGLPRAVVEAMSRGCPVVGSTAGGIPELLDDDCLHRPGDAAGLARLLARASDPAWQRQQAQRNVEVAARYAPAALNERRRAFWQSFADVASGRTRDPRVLLVTPYAQLGGSERQLLRLLGELPPEQVAGVVSLQEGPLLKRLDSPVVIPTGPGAADVVRAARAVRKVIAETTPDVVHASCAKGALVAGLAALGTGVPVLFVKHDFSWDGPVAWLAASMCKQVVASSEALNATFPRPLRPRLHVVYPGVPTAPGDREAGRRRVRDLTGPSAGECVVGMVGRYHPDKGHLDAVAAIEDVPDAHLLLIGGVDETTPHYWAEVAERAAGGRVTMAGEQEDVVDLLAGCDVVVVPSLVREGFGLVPVEAFRAGTPVVAYGHGALPEVIGDCGVLVPPADTAALAAAVKELLADAAQRARLADCGRERAERFTVEAMAAGMRARYRAATSTVN